MAPLRCTTNCTDNKANASLLCCNQPVVTTVTTTTCEYRRSAPSAVTSTAWRQLLHQQPPYSDFSTGVQLKQPTRSTSLLKMDEEDFETLLDAAFGIATSSDKQVQPDSGSFKHVQQQGLCAYDSSSSLEPSPASSPVHTYPSWIPGGSPCLSDASMQMHASPVDHGSGAGHSHLCQLSSSVLLYSPVRDGSPSPNEQTSPRTSQFLQVPVDQRRQQQQQVAAVFQHSQPMHHEHPHAAAPARPPEAPATASSIQRTFTKQKQQQQQLNLCSLPREVQMRVLCFLSADSLTSLAQTCCQLSSLCNEPVLWRRMFVHRWGKNVHHSNRQSWKVRYMECDAAELQASGAGLSVPNISDSMQNIFLQAHRAKRHKALGAGAVDDLMLVEDDDVAAKVLAWRKSRGFATHTGPDNKTPSQRPADLAAPHPSLNPGCPAPQGGFVTYAAGSGGWSTGQRRVVRRPACATTAADTRTTCAAVSSNNVPADADDTGTRGGVGVVVGGGGSCQGVAGGDGGVPAPCCHVATGLTPAATAGLTATQQGHATGTCHHLPVTPCQQPSPGKGVKVASPPAQGSSGSNRGAKRRRSRQPRRWTQIGNVFCDEKTGWVHVCDETCSEKIVEPSSGLLVCPISGTCSARLLTCAEEAEEEGDRDPDKEHREEDFGGERGRLARAFAAGYYCSDERELLRECGVYLPH